MVRRMKNKSPITFANLNTRSNSQLHQEKITPMIHRQLQTFWRSFETNRVLFPGGKRLVAWIYYTKICRKLGWYRPCPTMVFDLLSPDLIYLSRHQCLFFLKRTSFYDEPGLLRHDWNYREDILQTYLWALLVAGLLLTKPDWNIRYSNVMEYIRYEVSMSAEW